MYRKLLLLSKKISEYYNYCIFLPILTTKTFTFSPWTMISNINFTETYNGTDKDTNGPIHIQIHRDRQTLAHTDNNIEARVLFVYQLDSHHLLHFSHLHTYINKWKDINACYLPLMIWMNLMNKMYCLIQKATTCKRLHKIS